MRSRRPPPVPDETTASRAKFASLQIPNYRRFFVAWMQRFAQTWLVFELSNSATTVGLVAGLQALPLLVIGPYGGRIADRVDRRRLMIVLQVVMGLLALVLGVLTVTHAILLWEVFILAALLGLTDRVENPARQAFNFGLSRRPRSPWSCSPADECGLDPIPFS